jgi:alkylhydroperoxidase/carboxymuconolactone decarboxylase family protein YurZ
MPDGGGRGEGPLCDSCGVAWTDELDPYFVRLWAAFEDGLAARTVLDTRTRLLVCLGDCVVIGETAEVRRLVGQALAAAVPVVEVQEAILQACVYAGRPVVNRSLDVFAEAIAGTPYRDELLRARLPAEGPNASRTLEEERKTWLWGRGDDEFPRRQELMDRYGWQNISAMLSSQPGHRAGGFETNDRLDPGFTKLWSDFVHAGMYWRRVLDDRTRTLCMVGECIALQSPQQTGNHMRNALLLGSSREEVLEVVFQTTQYVGMPRAQWAREVLERVAAEPRLQHDQ